MPINRRHMLGALVAGSASALVSRSSPLLAPVPAIPVNPPKPAPVLAAVAVHPHPAHTPLVTRALAALDRHSARIVNRKLIGVVDFSAPSNAARLHLVDVASGRVVAEHLVAHGHGSDPDNSGWVERFSNAPGSNASSAGSYLTADIYTGKHGRSRRLLGLDPENSLAQTRGIVIHAAAYVDTTMARTQHRIGRSQGCFALSADAIGEVLRQLGPGCLLYAGK